MHNTDDNRNPDTASMTCLRNFGISMEYNLVQQCNCVSIALLVAYIITISQLVTGNSYFAIRQFYGYK